MRPSAAPFLFTGTMLAAAGYGATFLFSAYYRAHGGSDVDTGLTLAAAMAGTFTGVPLVGWLVPYGWPYIWPLVCWGGPLVGRP